MDSNLQLPPDQVLVYADRNLIKAWEGNSNPRVIADRGSGLVTALTLFNGRVIDGTIDKVIKDTLSGEIIEDDFSPELHPVKRSNPAYFRTELCGLQGYGDSLVIARSMDGLPPVHTSDPYYGVVISQLNVKKPIAFLGEHWKIPIEGSKGEEQVSSADLYFRPSSLSLARINDTVYVASENVVGVDIRTGRVTRQNDMIEADHVRLAGDVHGVTSYSYHNNNTHPHGGEFKHIPGGDIFARAPMPHDGGYIRSVAKTGDLLILGINSHQKGDSFYLADTLAVFGGLSYLTLQRAEGRFYDREISQMGNPILIVSKDHLQ
ncbi:hypothetical protein J4401_03260 [Candidatus Woesearchaeota archaeon]|nr:hypothetical protein [Candidatus Woesearchaeota archaeon]